MTSPATTQRTLSTAEQRRAELVEAAVRVFAERGYAAPTTEIAKAAGISQAYLFRLFPTKPDLFAAAYEVASNRMYEAFAQAAAEAKASGEDPLEAMGRAYTDLIRRDREVLLMQIHSYVGAGIDDAARAAVHRCFERLYDLLRRETGASEQEAKQWFAYGMLINVMAAIHADEVDAEWAQVLTQEPEEGDC